LAISAVRRTKIKKIWTTQATEFVGNTFNAYLPTHLPTYQNSDNANTQHIAKVTNHQSTLTNDPDVFRSSQAKPYPALVVKLDSASCTDVKFNLRIYQLIEYPKYSTINNNIIINM